MKGEDLKLEETENSLTLGGLSNTLKYNNLGGVSKGVVAFSGFYEPPCIANVVG
jgi:hypothetical protein